MRPQIFLVAPMNAKPDDFGPQLNAILDATQASALLLPRGARSDVDYEAFINTVLPVAQKKNCAVLIDNDPQLARKVKADGAHITGDLTAIEDALSQLKPNMIVGAGNLQSRHDAMEKAEAGADYMFFGPLSGQNHKNALDEAHLWAETVEVPAVLSMPETALSDIDPKECEFVALSDQIWGDIAAAEKNLDAFIKRMDTR